MWKKITIIVTEKSSMALNMQKHIWCTIKKNWYYQNSEGTIYLTRAVGHLLRLKSPSEIDDKYKLWKLDNLPIFVPFYDKYIPSDKGKEQLNKIYNLFKMNKDNEIEFYHTWDPDREGELIVRNITMYIKNRSKKEWDDIEKSIIGEYRLWLKDFSKKTIQNEMKRKANIKEYDNFYMASMARQHSDWLVWMNLTPYYTIVSWSYWNVLNVWRVQSAILKILVDKELDIQNFKEITTYKVLGDFDEKNEFTAEWFSKNLKDGKLVSKEQVKKVQDDLINRKEFTVIDKIKETKTESLKELYNLVNLQLDAEKKYWYKPTDTLSYMQNLYEKATIMSYPRANDSWYIADDDFWKLKLWFIQWLVNVPEYSKIAQKFITEWKVKANTNFVDNEKVWGHAWIYIKMPDDESRNFEDEYAKLDINEKNIMRLIINRILGVMNWNYIYESSELKLNNWPHFFKIWGKILKELGWKEYYKLSDKKNEDKLLPQLEKWSIVNLIKTNVKEVKNKKPTRYTAATLGKSIDDLASLLKDDPELSARIRKLSPKTAKWDRKLWLWTWGTRWNIIDWLAINDFIMFTWSWKTKKIEVTNKWMKLVSIINEQFRDPVTTGKWEDYLKKIEDWEWTYKEFIDELKNSIKSVVNEKKIIANKKYKFHNMLDDSIWVCPLCWVWEIKSWDKWFSCSSAKCNFIIWKTMLGHKFNIKEIETLLEGWILEKISLYSEKKKKQFTTNLKLDVDTWKIVFK